MQDRLLASTTELTEILSFTVPGIHFEKLGAWNQPWDRAVAQAIEQAWSRIDPSRLGAFEWYAVHLRWFVWPRHDRQDLDNLRMKPILDCFTAKRLWRDDDVRHLRAIYSEVALVQKTAEQRVEVAVFGRLTAQ